MKKVNKIQKGIFSIVFFIGIWCLPICSKEAYASSEMELLRVAVSHLKEDVNELETQLNTHIQNDSTTDGKDGVNGKDGANGKDGVGISKIEKTGTEGNVDTYAISLTNGTVYNFTVTNGVNGKDGVDGQDGVDGKDGVDGQDGIDGKDAHIDTGTQKESGSTMGVLATAMASVSLLGNIILTTFFIKKKKN